MQKMKGSRRLSPKFVGNSISKGIHKKPELLINDKQYQTAKAKNLGMNSHQLILELQRHS